jgi:hypothetical protein
LLFKFFSIIPAMAHWRQVKDTHNGFNFREKPFACHFEAATRSGLMVQKKMFPNMLIETTATEESRFPSLYRSSDQTWS